MISFVGAALTNPPGATSGPVTANLPSGIQPGDLMIGFASINKVPAVYDPPTNGWTLLRGQITETAITANVYYKFATVTGGQAFSVTTDVTGQHRLDVLVYRGVDPTAPFLAENARTEPGNSTTTLHSAPALTNTDAGAWGVLMACFRQVPTPASWSPGVGLTRRVDADSGNDSSANLTQAAFDTNGPVATGSHTFSGVSSSGTAQAVMWGALLRPEPAGPTPGQGSAAGTWGFTGAAVGVRNPVGSAAGTWTFTGAASGAAPVVGAHTGTAAGTWTFTGAAVGHAPPVVIFLRHRPGTATLASNGVSTATLATTETGTAVGFGSQPFGTSPFGESTGVGGFLLPGTAVLADDGTSTATLHAEPLATATVHIND